MILHVPDGLLTLVAPITTAMTVMHALKTIVQMEFVLEPVWIVMTITFVLRTLVTPPLDVLTLIFLDLPVLKEMTIQWSLPPMP
jgi:hypothetical protein